MGRTGPDRVHTKFVEHHNDSIEGIEEWGPEQHRYLHIYQTLTYLGDALDHMAKLIRHADEEPDMRKDFVEIRTMLMRAQADLSQIEATMVY